MSGRPDPRAPRARRPGLLAALLLGSACAGPSAAPSGGDLGPRELTEPPVRINGSKPRPPDVIPGWTPVYQEEETVDLGLQTRYQRADGLLADTWVYPVVWPDALCRLDCLEGWITQEADEFRDFAPEQLIAAGRYSAMEVLADDTLPAPAPGLTPVRHLAFRVEDEGGNVGRSDFLLAGGHGYRLKVRLTDYNRRAADTTARDLFFAYAAGVVWPYECLLGLPPVDDAPRMETTVDVAPQRMVEIIDSLLADAGHQLKSRNGAWSTVASFEWPEGTAPEAWHGEASPGYQLLVLLESRQDSTAFAVQGSVVCDIGDPQAFEPGSVMSNLRLIVALTFTAKITEVLEGSRRPAR